MQARKLLLFISTLFLALATLVAPAAAQTPPYPVDPGGDDVEVLPDTAVNPDGGEESTDVLGNGATLPVTGGDVLGLAVIGAAALGGGAVIVGARRRQHD